MYIVNIGRTELSGFPLKKVFLKTFLSSGCEKLERNLHVFSLPENVGPATTSFPGMGTTARYER